MKWYVLKIVSVYSDINGLAVCMKMGNVPSDESLQDPLNASSSPAHGYILTLVSTLVSSV